MQVTHDGQRWSNTAEDIIEVVDADPSWPGQFVTESSAILQVLHPLQPRLEHFGSTAVPHLPAKPIIDIILVADASEWPRLVAPLTSLGYRYWSENPRPDRMFFVKGMPPFGRRRTHHVHVRTPQDVSELVFRDWLRAHPADAAHYARLKRDLAARFQTDREAYTAAKGEFIEQIFAQAKSNGPSAA
jgi:GrpB-like predicted nucleotidyltransferase (UPF0157 family)